MKSLKSLFFAAVILVLVPTASSAVIGDILCGLLPCDGGTPPPAAVPEPSGALVMGAALLVLAVARRARK